MCLESLAECSESQCLALLEAEKLKSEVNRDLIEAYKAKIQAYTAEVEAYNTLVKAATGETVSAEDLGGADVHGDSDVARLRKRFPKVNVSLHQGNPQQVARMVIEEVAEHLI